MTVFPQLFWTFSILLFLQTVYGASDTSDIDENDTGRSGPLSKRQSSFFNRGQTKFQYPSIYGNAQSLYQNDQRNFDGSYNYEYITDNGIQMKEDSVGQGVNRVVTGSYSYVGADGVTYTVNYIADRNGFRAYGAHLPQQPDAVYDVTRLPEQPNRYSPFPQPQQQPSRPFNNQFGNRYQQQGNSVVSTTIQPPPPRRPFGYYPNNVASQSQNVYVQQPTPPNFVTITPKPAYAKPLISNELPFNYVKPSQQYYWAAESNDYENPYDYTGTTQSSRY